MFLFHLILYPSWEIPAGRSSFSSAILIDVLYRFPWVHLVLMLEALGRQLYQKCVHANSLHVEFAASSWVFALLPLDFLSLVSVTSLLHHLVDVPVERTNDSY